MVVARRLQCGTAGMRDAGPQITLAYEVAARQVDPTQTVRRDRPSPFKE
jgi:hypothetical protein